MRFLSSMKSSALWFGVPTIALLCAVAWASSNYTPLQFDASLYDARAAETADLAQVEVDGDAAGTASAASASGVSAALGDGTWTGYAVCGEGNGDGWKPYYVAVTVTVRGGEVASIDKICGSSTDDSGDGALSWDADENQSYLDWAISGRTTGSASYMGVRAQIEDDIDAGVATTSVDVVSGATFSSDAILEAYNDALSKSAASVGSSVDDVATSSSVSSSSGARAVTKVSADLSNISALGDGTWTGYAVCGEGNGDGWKPYYVAVTVTVRGGEVASIDKICGSSTDDSGDGALSWDADENQSYLDWAISGRSRSEMSYTGVQTQLEATIAAGSLPTSIDVVSGATYSSKAIFNAYYAALEKSAASVGSKVDEVNADVAAGSSSDDNAQDNGSVSVETPDIELGDELDLDGTYMGYALCLDEDNPSEYSPYYVIVQIEVVDNKIATISNVYGDTTGSIDPLYIYDVSENGAYLNKAINGYGLFTKGVKTQIQDKLDAGEDVTDIDVVSGATWSSYAIVDAYAQAVQSLADAAVTASAEEEQEPADEQ